MKKLFVLLLAFALSLISVSSAFAFTYEEIDIRELYGEPTVEKPSSWAESELERAVNLGLVPEYLNKGYTQTITRAEFCALAVTLYEKVSGSQIKERKTFNDTRDVNVQKMGALGVVTGVGNGNFSPDALLTREQAAAILARLCEALGKPLDKKETTFSDKDQISSWALGPVGQVQAAGIMSGTGNNRFSPKGNYTREQSILTMVRIYDMLTR